MTYPELRAFATSIKPGDHQTAYSFLNELAITLREEKSLKPHERRYLYRLRRIWQDRADGKDARWDVYGCRAGAIPKPIVEALQRGVETNREHIDGFLETALFPVDPFADAREGFEREAQRLNDLSDAGNWSTHATPQATTPEEPAERLPDVQAAQDERRTEAREDPRPAAPEASPRSGLASILDKYR
jgi:hypothetical protein